MTTSLPGVHGRPALSLGQHRHDPQIAQWLEVMVPGAVTIAQLVHISEHVVDACVVYATTAATTLFGFDQPDELVGQFISQLHHPEDALITRQYALARLHHEWYPQPYPMRILRAPTGQPVPVMKHVKQVLLHGVLTWITVHTPFDYATPFCMPVTPAMLARAGSASERQLLGVAHVAYMDQLMQAPGSAALPPLTHVVDHSDSYLPYDPKQGKIAKNLSQKKGMVNDLFAKTLEILLTADAKRQRHLCFKCYWPWYSQASGRRPTKCPNCGDKHWDKPYATARRWHTAAPEGEAS